MRTPKLAHRLGAEALGTFWLVLGGCGSAIFAAKFLDGDTDTGLGIGFVGVSLAFGLTVLTMAYAVGHVSGGHFNPAVTIGAAVAKRFDWKDVPAYIGTQVVAGLLAGGVLYAIASGKDGFDAGAGFAANGYAEHSPGGYSLVAVLIAEVVLTAFFQDGTGVQLWAFWLAPIVGAVIAGATYALITGVNRADIDVEGV